MSSAPLVKEIHSRGARTTVIADARVLWLPGGQIALWENRLSNKVTRATRLAAPSNSRPHWMHYGRKLAGQGSFTSKTKLNGMHITTVLGSKVSHALYVDQGTGIYAGKSPWKAAILPPRERGGSDLYEATWRPHKNSGPQGARMIEGQRGQFFFAEGLRAGLMSMRIPSVEVADAVVASKTRGGNVQALVNSLGLPVDANGAFKQQLEQWREWRDEAFYDPRRPSRESNRRKPKRARNYGVDPATRARLDREKSKRYRDKIRGGPVKPRKTAPKKPVRTPKPKSVGTTSGKAQFKAAMLKKYGRLYSGVTERNGRYYVLVQKKDERGRNVFDEVSAPAR